MESENKIIINGKSLAEVIFFETSKITNPKEFVKSGLERFDTNFFITAGFSTKKDFADFFTKFVIGKNETSKIFPFGDDIKINIINSIKEVLKKCSCVFDKEIIKILISPSIDEFSLKRMGGVNGYCTSRLTIFIGINLLNKNWKNNFEKTLAHELAHALSPFYDMENMSIGEGIVFDGIAENFKEKFVDKEKSPWVKSVSKGDSVKIFNNIKSKLGSRDVNLYSQIFFGTGKYPLWAGYSIGYYLIKSYIKLNNLNWKELLRKDPKEILKEIVFISPFK